MVLAVKRVKYNYRPISNLEENLRLLQRPDTLSRRMSEKDLKIICEIIQQAIDDNKENRKEQQ
jgi:hypothetical protein